MGPPAPQHYVARVLPEARRWGTPFGVINNSNKQRSVETSRPNVHRSAGRDVDSDRKRECRTPEDRTTGCRGARCAGGGVGPPAEVHEWGMLALVPAFPPAVAVPAREPGPLRGKLSAVPTEASDTEFVRGGGPGPVRFQDGHGRAGTGRGIHKAAFPL